MEALTAEEQQILRDVFEWEGVKFSEVGYYEFANNDKLILDGDYSRKELLAFAVAMNTMQEFARKKVK